MIATDNCSSDNNYYLKTDYRFHGGVGVCDEVLRPYEEELIPRDDAQPADNVEVVQTEAEPRTFTGNFRGIANSWAACASVCGGGRSVCVCECVCVCVWGWWRRVRGRRVNYEVCINVCKPQRST